MEETGRERQERADNDGTWKDLIENLWARFIQRTLPDLYRDLDLSRPPEFLTQELRDPLPEAMRHTAAYSVDELMKVYLKSGEFLWVYLHVEIQGPGGGDIAFRMFSYCCLIVAHYHEMPVALAIFTSPRPAAEREKGKPGTYETMKYGTWLKYQYNCVELYALDDEELLRSDNPIDVAFYAAKKSAICQGKERQKLTYLRELTRILAEKGWDEKERREIFTFIARIINLKDPELRTQYLAELKAAKEETEMESFVEKYFKDQGRAEGKEEGRAEAVSFMAANGVPSEVIARFQALFPAPAQS